jgi:hypothetical protein
VSVKIDNSSVFVPGGNVANSQYGFRRCALRRYIDLKFILTFVPIYSTEIIAQNNRTLLESGKTVWHFSIMRDEIRPLNYKHEYQIVFIEPDDGSKSFSNLVL